MSIRTVFVTAVLALTLFVGGTAAADKVNSAFAGKIMLSDKRFPSQAKSLAAFNAKIRSLSKTTFMEDKEKKGTWKIQFAGFLKAPLNDLEYIVKVYELSGNGQQLLVSFEQFTSERGMTALVSNMTLEKKVVGVNKNLLVTMESKGRVLASNRFKIIGEGEHYSGKVNFSEEEAGGSGSDEKKEE